MKRVVALITFSLLTACTGEQVQGNTGLLRAHTDSVRGVTCYTMTGADEISCVRTDK